MKHKIIFLLACTLLSTYYATAQTTQKFTASKINEYGLAYTLPVTAIDITLEAERTECTPGEFSRYARKYLGIDPITTPSVNHTLKSAVINSHGTPDAQERYLVQFKSGSAPYIVLTDTDLPLSINVNREPQDTPSLPQPREAETDILSTPAAAQAMTAEMLQSPSSAKRAELAAARIYELRQNRADIISGQADQMPSDGQAMQLALDNINRQEEALTAMFIGTRRTSTQVRTYTVVPQTASQGSTATTVIARLSASQGLIDADDLSGAPVSMQFTVESRGTLPKNEKGEEKRFPKGGLAYCIPGTASITVSDDSATYAETRLPIAQLGIIFGLDPGLFTDKKAPAYATFDPATGGIITLGTITERQ